MFAFSCIVLLIAYESVSVSSKTSPPIFIYDMNNLVLSESTPVGEAIATLQGTDADGGPVSFGLHGTDRFKVDKVTGQVTLVKPLDHEVLSPGLF